MDLVRAAQRGNPDAMLRLFDEYHAPLFRFAYRLTASAMDAAEMVQQSFLALLAPDCAYDPRRAPLQLYLFGAIRSQIWARVQRRAACVDGSPLPESPAAAAVMRLPEAEREVFVLAHYDHVPLADIGRLLEIDLPAVKTHLQRARTSLRETFSEPDRQLDRWTVPACPPSLREDLLATHPACVKQRRLRFRWVMAFLLAAGSAGLAIAMVRHGVLASDAGAWDDYTYVRRTRFVRPSFHKLRWIFMGVRSTGWQWWEGKVVGSVYLYDRFSHVHYGYSWTAQPRGGGEYWFTVLPLDPSAVKEDGPIVSTALPQPTLVSAGGALEVNLYRSPTERVYDRIELSGEPMSISRDRDPPHETVAMTLSNPKLYINGRFASDDGGVVNTSGLTVTIDVPGRGRFVLALYQGGNPAFIRAGTISGNALEFEWAGETFRVECAMPITPTGVRPVYAILQTRAKASAFRFGSGGAPGQYR
jgi:RNA polymerase sigma-70 factor (ECF subfamily)